MKVLAALADYASLNELEFKKSVDTAAKKTETLSIKETISGPSSSPKRYQAITHFTFLSDGTIATGRKHGEIALGTKTIGNLTSDVVGLTATKDDIIIAFGSNGDCLAVDSDSNKYKFKLREGLSSVVENPKQPLEFASAGSEPLPDIFTVAFDKSTKTVKINHKWKATQPPNNILDLPEQNLVTALAFIEPNGLVSVTSNGRIRLYDIESEDGQPEEMTQASKDAIKTIVADPEYPGTFIIGDSRTTVSRWSTRPFKLLGHYKGVSGSTRALSVRGPYLAVGGLDRYVRVFHIEKRQPAGKVFLGGQIWAIALQRHDLEEEENELDEFWDEIGSESKRRKITPKPESEQNTKASKKQSKPADEDSEEDLESEETSATSDEEDSFEGFDD